ncbi:helix-turn-helix domain-containing protein [Phycicoccus sp. MAQZ13P-2]|uniref:helix-turn-helix domain-containing protein n=1 Tax=Phycicoccus mangrovi TaxID=2840470 RepID=UPI001C004D36|nr:helix-turn-helix domain-containing protein [Phycicoccus mangrovi]MBT9254440.1 helix-turn-helix domain-containing protein [Phycicoccus mangrovi]MBT9272818.1 helix-turn-helix domain-containing protein [Phycicoccus mangrovi]
MKPTARLVHAILLEHCDERSRTTMRNADIAALAGRSKRMCEMALRELREAGVIETTFHPETAERTIIC